jgi:hypothetical protein
MTKNTVTKKTEKIKKHLYEVQEPKTNKKSINSTMQKKKKSLP